MRSSIYALILASQIHSYEFDSLEVTAATPLQTPSAGFIFASVLNGMDV